MSVFHENMLIGSSGQGAPAAAGISRSLRFNSSDSAYLSRTPASAGNRRTWTWAGWVKRSGLDTYTILSQASTDGFRFSNTNALEGYGNFSFNTAAVFRDTAAWYHVVVAIDTTQATNTNRIKLYVNGVLQSFSSASYPTQNTDTLFNSTNVHYVGTFSGLSQLFSGYLADIYFIDGQALDPSSFTETDATTGQLIPKAYTGSYGTNGFHLEFADNSSNTATTLGKDTSGNGNNWTPNNLSVTAGAGNDSLVDVPTNGAQTDTGVGGEVRGNYATLNPLDQVSTTLTNGNLDASIAGAATAMTVGGTIAVTSGKWYWEVTCSSSNLGIGVQKANLYATSLFSSGVSYYSVSGQKYVDGTASNYGSTFTTNDVIGVALDLDGGTVQFYKNNTAQGSITLPTSTAGWKAAVTNGTSGGTNSVVTNFGQRAFAYTAPSGFKALCTANLPAPLVTKPSTVMDVLLWTGNGSSTRSISGLAFSPEFVWFKARSAAYANQLYDVVRGSGSGKNLISNQTDSEGAGSSSFGYLSSFDSAGFSLAVGSDSTFQWGNQSSATYAAWCWDAGSSTVTNTQGSITSTVSVRANATAGFSIVTYAGTGVASTVGHGLGAVPGLIIIKDRTSGAYNWQVYHSTFAGTSNTIVLNSTAAVDTGGSAVWNSTTPTSTVFSIGTAVGVNTNGNNYVAYCFAPVVGYSSFGSWTGNGSADGPFVFTGMRPRYILWKRTDSTSDWTVLDAARDTYNYAEKQLVPNTSGAEQVTGGGFVRIDFLSNGFKLRGSDIYMNANNGTYIYAAFAESPFNYARAR